MVNAYTSFLLEPSRAEEVELEFWAECFEAEASFLDWKALLEPVVRFDASHDPSLVWRLAATLARIDETFVLAYHCPMKGVYRVPGAELEALLQTIGGGADVYVAAADFSWSIFMYHGASTVYLQLLGRRGDAPAPSEEERGPGGEKSGLDEDD